MSETPLHEWLARLDFRRWRVFLTARARQGWRRVRGSFVPVVQSAAGASLAWVIAHDLLGGPSPVFAPIAAWICLGFRQDRVPRKVAELGQRQATLREQLDAAETELLALYG